ncbi:hypothetical protein INS49_008711 [Diaporthe citri]|uniref:uncharacterized protein n=1 Tax=Diaporthe citri TaxID=83186 RepID=UPI001C7FF13F|nr:uncharacterized protein INS49_008711 [Diaporthe citri]KAG6363610.1 hypothetical protein INS49_008711 [Diaporthe citri]
MASGNDLPASFRDSYIDRESYPMNVVERTISTYPSALAEYLRRLDDAADDLCVRDISKIDVPFRDLQVQHVDGGWKGVEKRNIHSPEDLDEWLGVKTAHPEDEKKPMVTVRKQDPKCRFMFTRLAVIGPTGKSSCHHLFTARDIQDLLLWEERLSEAVTVLSSNIDIMNSLSDFYLRLTRMTDSGPASRCQEDTEVFSNDLGNLINNFQLQVNRSKALAKTLTDRTEMVKQHRLERLNQHMESEAIVVRIVAIVTLVYLPATFTSTFFSTDVIKYQGQESGGSFSQVAMNRWLEVTIPLTALTLLLAYAGKRWAEMVSHPEDSEKPYKRYWPNGLMKAPPNKIYRARLHSAEKLDV